MPKPSIITGLDIGSSSIKLLSVLRKNESPELEVLTQMAEPSFGVRRGVVIDRERVAQIIDQLLDRAQKEAGEPIKEIFLNVGGSHLFSVFSRGTIAVSRADQKISQEDIERVIAAAQTFSLPPNREIIKVFPKEFIIDGEAGIKEPLGMAGVRLESEILVLGAFSPYLNNLTRAVLSSELVEIADLIPNPLASAASVLTPKEKELGVLLLDIGAGTTDLAVFLEGGLIHAGVIPIGSGHITSDIAIALKTDIDTAERIKLELGSCFLRGSKKLKIEEGDSGENLVFSQKVLGQAIDSRVNEIFDQAKKELKKLAVRLPGGIVLVGGGIKLSKTKDLAKKELGLSARIGKPFGFNPALDDPALACVCGLVSFGAEVLVSEGTLMRNLSQKAKKLLKSFMP